MNIQTLLGAILLAVSIWVGTTLVSLDKQVTAIETINSVQLTRAEIIEIILRHKNESRELSDKSYYMKPDLDFRLMSIDNLDVHLEYTKKKVEYLEKRIEEKKDK